MGSKKQNQPLSKTKSTPLVGQFFHSIKDGGVNWQGNVIGNPEPGWYLVQLYEWLLGEPNVQRLVKFEDMTGWLFYDTTEQMQFSYEYGVAREGGPFRTTKDTAPPPLPLTPEDTKVRFMKKM